MIGLVGRTLFVGAFAIFLRHAMWLDACGQCKLFIRKSPHIRLRCKGKTPVGLSVGVKGPNG